MFASFLYILRELESSKELEITKQLETLMIQQTPSTKVRNEEQDTKSISAALCQAKTGQPPMHFLRIRLLTMALPKDNNIRKKLERLFVKKKKELMLLYQIPLIQLLTMTRCRGANHFLQSLHQRRKNMVVRTQRVKRKQRIHRVIHKTNG